MNTENLIVVDSFFARKFSISNSLYLLDDELLNQKNTIKIEEVEAFNMCCNHTTNEITSLILNSTLFKNNSSIKTVLRPSVSMLVYVLLDRIIRINRIEKKLFKTLKTPKVSGNIFFENITDLYSKLRDKPEHNQFIFNRISQLKNDNNIDTIELNKDIDQEEWSNYEGFYNPKKNKFSEPLNFIIKRFIFNMIKKTLFYLKKYFYRYNFINSKPLIIANGLAYSQVLISNSIYISKKLNIKWFKDYYLNKKKYKIDKSKRDLLFEEISKKCIDVISYNLNKNSFNNINLTSIGELVKLLVEMIPSNSFEGINSEINKYVSQLPRNKGSIYLTGFPSATGSYSFITAAAKRLKYKVVGVQHSGRGGYLANDAIIAEENISGSDYYITSGWNNKETSLPIWKNSAIPLPSPSYTFARKKNLFKGLSGKKIVFVGLGEIYPYTVRYDGTYYLDGRKLWSDSIYEIVSKLTKNEITVYVNSYCKLSSKVYVQLLNKLKRIGKNCIVNDAPKKGDARNFFKIADATIWDVPAGGFVESWMSSTPAYSLSSSKLMQFQEDSKPYIEDLKSSGILCCSNINLVNSVLRLISEGKIDIQTELAVNKFLDKYTRTSKNWEEEWVNALNAKLN